VEHRRLTAAHIADIFDLIQEWNAELRAARAERRSPVLPGDVRWRAKFAGVATQRRVYPTLRNALNFAVRKQRLIDFNPCDGVEMPAEHRDPRLVWSPEQVGQFLDATTDDRLHTPYHLLLPHSPRRGEAVGARRSAFDHDARERRVVRPLLQLRGRVVESRPKTRAGSGWSTWTPRRRT
jgi:hypothetical protein